MNFFYLLEEERKRLGLSQAEAGRICGVSREMWGKYERDQAAPGADVLEAFAAAGADVNYILSGRLTESQTEPRKVSQSVQPYGLSAAEDALLAAYRRSSPEAQAVVLRALGVPEKPAKPLVRPSAQEFGPSKDLGSQPRIVGEEPGEEPGSSTRKKGKK